MAVINLADGSTLELYEVGENSKFESLTLEDSMGGDYPKGVLTIRVDYDNYTFEQEAIRFKYKQYDGLTLKCKGTIYHTEFKGFTHIIKFVLLPKDFMTDNLIRKYNSFDDVIGSLWKGEKDINTRSDVLNSLELNQCNMNSHKYLSDLLKGYRKNSIFGFALDSLVIRNLELDAPALELVVQEDTAVGIGKSKYFDKAPKEEYVGYKEANMTQGSYVATFAKEYSPLFANYFHNIRYYTDWRMSLSLKYKYIPKAKIGDQLTLKSERHKFKHAVVWKRMIRIDGSELNIDLYIKSN